MALKFIKVEHSDALKTFLVKKLASLQEKVRSEQSVELRKCMCFKVCVIVVVARTTLSRPC